MYTKCVVAAGSSPQAAVEAMAQEALRQYFAGENNGNPELLLERKEKEAEEEARELILCC
jgi:hypothetical protein